MIRSVYLSFALIILAAYSAEAQFWFLGQNAKERYEGMPFKPHSSVSFGAGSSNYLGDLVPAAGLFFGRSPNDALECRASVYPPFK